MVKKLARGLAGQTGDDAIIAGESVAFEDGAAQPQFEGNAAWGPRGHLEGSRRRNPVTPTSLSVATLPDP